MSNKTLMKASISFACMAMSNQSMATTPWVMEEGTSSIYVSYIDETFDEKYLGSEGATPISQIDQQTTTVTVYYGLSEKTTITGRIGYTESEWDATSYRYDGLADTKITLTHELQNQYLDGKDWTLSALAGLTIGGTYKRGAAGRPHAPGDDANGLEAAIMAGRQLSDRWSTNFTLGYRLRDDAVPNEIFYNAAVHYSWTSQLSTSLVFDATNALTGDDITDADFAGEFHKTEEDRALVDLVMSYRFSQFSVSAGYSEVVDISVIGETRNTGKTEIYHLSVGYNL